MNLIVVTMVTAGLLITIWAVRKINMGTIFLSALLGLSSLFAVDLLTGYMRFNLPINCTTLLCSVLGGIPGVILILMMNVILNTQ